MHGVISLPDVTSYDNVLLSTKTLCLNRWKRKFKFTQSFFNLDQCHWSSSHYPITYVHNKNSNIQGRSPNVVKVIFHTIKNSIWLKPDLATATGWHNKHRLCFNQVDKELLLKERISSLWEQILSLKRSSQFEKGRNWREPLQDQICVLATLLNVWG